MTPSSSDEPLFIRPPVAVIRDADGKLRVRWPEGVDTVPIDELALRLLVDLANEGLRHECADRLADFIIDHIGKPYTVEECGHVLEVRLPTRHRHMLDHRPITDD